MIEMHQTTLSDEVDSRLSDIFSDAGPVAAPESPSARGEETLLDLRATVLSLDWEITDEVMERFIGQAEEIKGVYPEDRHVQTCGQLLISLGKYMRARRGASHPDTARLVNSVFTCLDKILRSSGLREQDKNAMVFKEIQAFKRLKEEIVRGRQSASVAKKLQGARAPGPVPQTEKGTDPDRVDPASGPGNLSEPLPGELREMLSRALEEMRAMIRGELDTLKGEVKAWMMARPR